MRRFSQKKQRFLFFQVRDFFWSVSLHFKTPRPFMKPTGHDFANSGGAICWI
jgi:hypothetical protein